MYCITYLLFSATMLPMMLHFATTEFSMIRVTTKISEAVWLNHCCDLDVFDSL